MANVQKPGFPGKSQPASGRIAAFSCFKPLTPGAERRQDVIHQRPAEIPSSATHSIINTRLRHNNAGTHTNRGTEEQTKVCTVSGRESEHMVYRFVFTSRRCEMMQAFLDPNRLEIVLPTTIEPPIAEANGSALFWGHFAQQWWTSYPIRCTSSLEKYLYRPVDIVRLSLIREQRN